MNSDIQVKMETKRSLDSVSISTAEGKMEFVQAIENKALPESYLDEIHWTNKVQVEVSSSGPAQSARSSYEQSSETRQSLKVYRPSSARSQRGNNKSKSGISSLFGAPSIPESEAQTSSKSWLKLYGLCNLKLDLNKKLDDCKHVSNRPSSGSQTAKYCPHFPSIYLNGTLKNVYMSAFELTHYERTLEIVLRRYIKRMTWLLSGSRQVFGTVIHKSCVILIDTSGSMTPHLATLKKELASLIWEQFYSTGCSFNLMCFSGKYEMWSDQLQEANTENCHSALEWVSKLKTGGSTKTLEALKLAFDHPGAECVYLLTDGIPDLSTSAQLQQLLSLNKKHIPINTTSFNCNDNTAKSFMQSLAIQTGGRYHQCPRQFDIQKFAEKVMEAGKTGSNFPDLPTFESDDLYWLGQEISMTTQYLKVVKQLREMESSKSKTVKVSTDKKSDTKKSLGSTNGTKGSKIISKKVSENYNFFRDVYWVPGIWHTFWKYPAPKHLRGGMFEPDLPDKEEQITTEEWLKRYRMSLFNIDLEEMVAGEGQSKFSDIYARFYVRGVKKYLRVLPQELIYYEVFYEKFYKRYLKRLHWLLTSSRLVFGTVIHKNCVVVVDVSGSMGPHMDIMKDALQKLIWEQIGSQDSMFTVMQFSNNGSFWMDNLMQSTKENCKAAVSWISKLSAGGGTNTLEALQKSLSVSGIDAVYFLSDGKPNAEQTPDAILKEVETKFKNRVPVNTISFNCKDQVANVFLEKLATQTGGRYHRYRSDSKAFALAPKLEKMEMTEADFALLSEFEGEDLRKISEEIKICRGQLLKIRRYRALAKKKEEDRPYDWAKSPVWPRTKLHKFYVQRPSTYARFTTRPKSALE